MADAVYREMVIPQNADFEEVFVVKDAVTKLVMDLTGYTARMMAKSLDGTTTLFDIVPTIDGPAGKVTIKIPGATTSGFTWNQGRYDLKVEGGAPPKSLRVLRGYVSISPGVTPA